MALSFASVAGITLLAGLWPGIIASIFNTAFFDYFVLSRSGQSLDFLRTTLILAVGLLITFFCERQRRAQRQLRLANASLQTRTASLMEAQQGSNSVTWTVSAKTRRKDWADGGAQVFGRSFSEISSIDSVIQAMAEEDRARFQDVVMRAISARESFHVEFRVSWPNGELHWLESRGTPSSTNADIWRGVTIDITERKNAEIALIRSEKLAAIGRLSATIAHEINNPLEAITNLIFLASADPALADETRHYLQDADRELARLANIARRTLTFVRSRSSVKPADVADVAGSVVAMFQPRCASRNAEIRLNEVNQLKIAVPSDDLWQILTNLISNACDALSETGGVVEIRTIHENGRASIYVSDNGGGIAPENRDHIFDPFFTTKPEVGTGIGLWVTKDLVEENGGSISLQPANSTPGFATTFRIEFPIS